MKNKLIIKQEIDLKNTYSEDVIRMLGLADLDIQKLLKILREGFEKINESLRNRLYLQDMQAYHDLGVQCAPVCFAIFERLSGKGEQPRLPAHLAVNRYQSTMCEPNSIVFWADPDATIGLYESLKKDGYYAST